jgi:hypothetical protein
VDLEKKYPIESLSYFASHTYNMFGALGKQYANVFGDTVEGLVGQCLGAKTPERTERATEKLGEVQGKRKALFIGSM